jgi:hypothetical protein
MNNHSIAPLAKYNALATQLAKEKQSLSNPDNVDQTLYTVNML